MRNHYCKRRGAALIWVLLMMVVLIGFVGLGTDVGWLVLSAQQLQTGADAAALAAAQRVTYTQDGARDAALDVAGKNTAGGDAVGLDRNDSNDPTGDVVVGRYDQNENTFTPTTASPNAVKVVARRQHGHTNGLRGVPLTFGRVFNVNEVDMERSAIAIAQNSIGAVLLVLDPTGECALDIQGGPTLNVTGGAIQVNSTNAEAACNGGSAGIAQISAAAINIVGDSELVANDASVSTNQPEIADPLASLPAPENGPTRASPGNGNATIQPGYYPNGIRRTGRRLIMEPGVYVIDNAQRGFTLSGQAALEGEGVMIYIKRGAINMTGGGLINLSPPTDGPYAGITVFQARDNYADSSIRGGNSLSTITGILYFPNNLVTLNGGGGTLGNQIIAWRIRLGGDGAMNVPFVGETGPPRVFLVQ